MAEYDWKSIKETAGATELAIVPDDTYDCEVIRGNAKATQKGDKDSVYGVFQILNGPHAGKCFMQQFVITLDNPVALGIFLQHMTAMGVELSNQEPADLAKEIVGARVRAVIKLDRRFNRMKVDAGGLTPLQDAPPAPAPVAAPPVAAPVAAPPVVAPTAAPAPVVVTPEPAPAPTPAAAESPPAAAPPKAPF